MASSASNILMLTVGLVLAAPAESAEACSSFACANAQLAPSVGTVPSNLPALWVAPGAYADSRAQVTLTRMDAVETVALSADHRLLSALTVGGRYRATLTLAAGGSCPTREIQTTFIAGHEAPRPRSLGRALVLAQGEGSTAVGFTNASCYSLIRSAYAELEPDLAGEAGAWRSTLVNVRAIVDGSAYWHSAEFQPVEDYYPTRGSGLRETTGGDLRVRVFVACEAIPSGTASSYVPIEEGVHRVKLVGTIAGFGELETDETTITLRCGSQSDAGLSMPSDGGAKHDATDAASSSDGGSAHDSAADAGGCSTATDVSSPGGLLALVLSAAVAVCRRRYGAAMAGQ